ncbi:MULTISPECIES: GNAT family N-acetyltransferase [Enterococcus]|uniref:GNAT family N-acetyltransferase n=1 Tax=Enterococcus alishanensis TaxID=1303817 RepID=A0ABS6T7K1_9ENTE|nr:GNAT family N-acetyltransferase [Enterococcus alishanensis]MBV7389104.1 GNAT family N-acetyltransferase [Enterococcus alishanensis]
MEKNKIQLLDPKEPVPWDLLLLADPSKEMIQNYLSESQLLVYRLEEIVGVLVYQGISENEVEIKNLAVAPAYQNKKIASQLLTAFFKEVRGNYQSAIVKTGDYPPIPLALYQKFGFEIVEVQKDYFVLHYEEPIIEDGKQLRDQIILRKEL